MALHLNSRKYLVDDTARESLHYFRQFRAVTAVLIIEDAEQNRRSNFPRKRAGCRGLSKRIDPCISNIRYLPQYFVMDIQYLRRWTNERVSRELKKKKFEIGGVWSFSKYSTVKRGMLPREWSISRLQERRRRTTKHICLRIACYFRYISKFFPLWIYSMATLLVELLKNNFDTGKIRKFFVYVRINIRILIIQYESESSLNRSRLFLFFSSQSRSISLN